MAIIATVMATNGVTVRVHDDRIAPPGSEDERRAIDAQRRAAYDILITEREILRDGDHQGLQGV